MTAIMDFLFQKSYNQALDGVIELKTRKSLALEDIVSELHKGVMALNMSDEMRMYLVERMSEIEYRLAQGSNEKVQICSLIGAFIEVRIINSKK